MNFSVLLQSFMCSPLNGNKKLSRLQYPPPRINMLIKRPSDIRPSEITDREVYRARRQFLQACPLRWRLPQPPACSRPRLSLRKNSRVRKSPFSTNEPATPYKEVTTYNNFYEFGTDKDDPAQTAKHPDTRPWTVAVEGEVKKPKVLDIEDLLKLAPLEERIYRIAASKAGPW